MYVPKDIFVLDFEVSLKHLQFFIEDVHGASYDRDEPATSNELFTFLMHSPYSKESETSYMFIRIESKLLYTTLFNKVVSMYVIVPSEKRSSSEVSIRLLFSG